MSEKKKKKKSTVLKKKNKALVFSKDPPAPAPPPCPLRRDPVGEDHQGEQGEEGEGGGSRCDRGGKVKQSKTKKLRHSFFFSLVFVRKCALCCFSFSSCGIFIGKKEKNETCLVVCLFAASDERPPIFEVLFVVGRVWL